MSTFVVALFAFEVSLGCYVASVSLYRLAMCTSASETKLAVRMLYACAFAGGLVASLAPLLFDHEPDFVEVSLLAVVTLQLWAFRSNWSRGRQPHTARSQPADFDSRPATLD